MTSSQEANFDSRALLIAGGISLLCVSACFVLLWAGQVALMDLFYALSAVLIAGVLYTARSAYYVGFTFWIWFVTPFVRRLLDYQTGDFTSVSLIMLTPYLVTGIAIFSLVRFGKHFRKSMYLPVGLAMLGVLYGYGVGVLSFGPFAASYNLLEWIAPLIFCFHILAHWREYPSHKRVVQSVFTWGVLILGTYGIIQFMVAPPWDAEWMINANMNSIGKPEPFKIRIFSMLNSPGPFAMVLMAGLLIMFTKKGFIARLGMAPGYVAFLLSMVRTAWGAWIIALLFVIRRITGPMRRRLVMLVFLGAILSVPLMLIGPISEQVGGRVSTLGNLEEDGSLVSRVGVYERAALIFSRPIGLGLGSLGGAAQFGVGHRVALDSGLLAIPYVLGWPGTLLFFGGLFLMVRVVLRTRQHESDEFGIFAGSIALAFMAALVFANQLIGPKGMVVWAFLALALSARAYHFEEDLLTLELLEEEEQAAEVDYA